MKLVHFTCPSCGAQLDVDASLSHAKCTFCGSSFQIDDGAKHVRVDNAEQAGYDFEKGRQRAMREQGASQTVYVQTPVVQPKPKRKTWLWVLGWIFMFPLPLTILMLRNEKIDKRVRIGIIIVAWLLYSVLMFSGGDDKSNSKPDTSSSAAVTTQVSSSSASASVSASSSSSASSASAQSSEAAGSTTIELVAGEKGEYGQELVMNEGTNLEETLIVYYVPAGDYQVKNFTSYRTQVSVYEGVKKGDDGCDEYTNTGDVISVNPGKAVRITVPEGWFIEVAEPGRISLTPVDW